MTSLQKNSVKTLVSRRARLEDQASAELEQPAPNTVPSPGAPPVSRER